MKTVRNCQKAQENSGASELKLFLIRHIFGNLRASSETNSVKKLLCNCAQPDHLGENFVNFSF